MLRAALIYTAVVMLATAAGGLFFIHDQKAMMLYSAIVSPVAMLGGVMVGIFYGD